MADGRPTPQAASSSRPRRGLGNGLGSLIPDAPPASGGNTTRPLDVLFPESASAQSSRTRGGSARELLQPRRSLNGRRNVSRETLGDQLASRPQRKFTTITVEDSVESPKNSVAPAVDAEGRPEGSKAQSAAVDAGTGRAPRSRNAAEETTNTVSTDPNVDMNQDSNVSRETLQNLDRANTEVSATISRGRATSNVVDAIMSVTQSVSRETSEDEPELMAVPGASFAVLRLDEIIPNSRQPREVFDEDDLAELAASITEVGVLQPIVVRPITANDEPTKALRKLLEARPEARYELIMGERRLRASELAGNATVPAIIRDTEDDELLRDALLENLHRVQLNPLEEASAYQQLMADFGATQEELAKRIARSRPQIANTLRLLKLPPAVQRKLAAGSISAGHARALLGLSEVSDMERLADRIVTEGLSVRTTEELVRLGLPRRSVAAKQPREKRLSPLGERLVSTLSDAYDTRVTISEGRRKGKIVIEFAGTEDLERIAALLVKG